MLKFIGEIRTPYTTLSECPRNISKNGPLCELKLNEEYKGGLHGLNIGEKIIILYWFDTPHREVKISKSCHGEGLYGTFALRTPHRPNPIACAILEISKIEETSVFVHGLDCLDHTKLLDIKPAIMDELNL